MSPRPLSTSLFSVVARRCGVEVVNARPASCQLLSVCGCAASPNVECALRLDNLESKQTPSKKPGHSGPKHYYGLLLHRRWEPSKR
jgi:hypothetical protein